MTAMIRMMAPFLILVMSLNVFDDDAVSNVDVDGAISVLVSVARMVPIVRTCLSTVIILVLYADIEYKFRISTWGRAPQASPEQTANVTRTAPAQTEQVTWNTLPAHARLLFTHRCRKRRGHQAPNACRLRAGYGLRCFVFLFWLRFV